MISDKSFLAIVPARGGSKGVPRKNIKFLGDRPLIAYTYDQIKAIEALDCSVLSSEDSEIRDVAENLGFRVVDRPPEFATDNASSESVMLNAVEIVEKEDGITHDFLILLEPTSPFRKPETILQCMRVLVDTGAPSVLTVAKTQEFFGCI